MQIGGFQKFSLIDYPQKIAAVIFTQGCNFRCPYCHNGELVVPSLFSEALNEDEVISFLFERKEKLQGVVITGGEPTLQGDLPEFLKKIKELGLSIKLDTNGSKPEVIKTILEAGLVDLLCMDVKGPLEKYSEISGVDVNTEDIKESIKIVMDSDVEHVFRTTIVKPLFKEDDIKKIPSLIPGANKYLLQNFVYQDGVLDKALLDTGHYSDEEFLNIKENLEWDNSETLEETI